MSSVSNEEAIITIKVKLVSETEGLTETTSEQQDSFLGDASPELTEIIDQEVKRTVDELIADSLEEAGVDLQAVQDMADMVDDIGNVGIKNVTNFAKNPEGFSSNMFMKILSKGGPYGAVAGAIITAILASPVLFKVLVEAFAVKGGPLNQDYRYSVEEQENQLYDRHTLFRRLTGDDPIITFNTLGFVTPSDPDFGGNSLVTANISRTGRVGLQNSSFGYIHGV